MSFIIFVPLHVMVSKAGIAQSVEQWIENPRVSSSNLDPGILIIYLLFLL